MTFTSGKEVIWNTLSSGLSVVNFIGQPTKSLKIKPGHSADHFKQQEIKPSIKVIRVIIYLIKEKCD